MVGLMLEVDILLLIRTINVYENIHKIPIICIHDMKMSLVILYICILFAPLQVAILMACYEYVKYITGYGSE